MTENNIVKPTVTIQNIHKLVSDEIRKLGIPYEFKGYEYIRDFIILIIEGTEIEDEKILYTKVANAYGANSSSVEKRIRYAIEIAFQRSDVFDVYQKKVFPNAFTNKKIKRPTNHEFVYKIYDIVSKSN